MIYVLAVAVAVLGILVTILASLTVYTADRLAKEAEKNVKLALMLIVVTDKNN